MIERITQLFQLSEDVPYHDTADALGLAYLASKAIT
jgi:Holliday junction resolvasome RuvABC endonuclease subunit